MPLGFNGFAPHRQGRIHIFCTNCGRKMSNVQRNTYDPPMAVLAHLPCERCSQGCKVDGPSAYLDARGRHVDAFGECKKCGDSGLIYGHDIVDGVHMVFSLLDSNASSVPCTELV